MWPGRPTARCLPLLQTTRRCGCGMPPAASACACCAATRTTSRAARSAPAQTCWWVGCCWEAVRAQGSTGCCQLRCAQRARGSTCRQAAPSCLPPLGDRSAAGMTRRYECGTCGTRATSKSSQVGRPHRQLSCALHCSGSRGRVAGGGPAGTCCPPPPPPPPPHTHTHTHTQPTPPPRLTRSR